MWVSVSTVPWSRIRGGQWESCTCGRSSAWRQWGRPAWKRIPTSRTRPVFRCHAIPAPYITGTDTIPSPSGVHATAIITISALWWFWPSNGKNVQPENWKPLSETQPNWTQIQSGHDKTMSGNSLTRHLFNGLFSRTTRISRHQTD